MTEPHDWHGGREGDEPLPGEGTPPKGADARGGHPEEGRPEGMPHEGAHQGDARHPGAMPGQPGAPGAGHGTGRAAGGDPASGPAGDPLPGASGGDLDEDALRRLLRDSVSDLRPSPGSLEELHRAVPARRARRRQVMIGAAAAVLLGGATIPALLHTDLMPGRGDKPMRAAGHSESHEPEDEAPDGARSGQTDSGRQEGRQGGGQDRGADAGAPSTGQSAGPDPSSTLGAVSPTCTRDQLGQGTATTGEPDPQGRVYGSFRVVNVSEKPCTVEGDGLVSVTATGGAQSENIQVLDHTTGDAATGLPDPATAPDSVVLGAQQAYVVRFAWIPREGGGTTGCSTSPSPSPGGSGDGTSPMSASGSTTTSGGGDGETGDGLEGGEGAPEEETGGTGSGGTGSGGSGSGGSSGGDATGGGSTGGDATGGTGADPVPGISVSHTPDVGDPVAATTVVEGACAGTLYRTGALPAS
ncbi:hypothetical protein [Streptomyces sp. JJ36]|uniref:hypothetical protein n=1 Tax=Streptomyces sp. JJ36 TaxID=2736645 RepID=UPI001F2CC3E1|nr:hypothetical protein [Streptomyces sp. JJ36]MCF6524273.1 hypothetical protein [Streptomyces sp. JJ36]